MSKKEIVWRGMLAEKIKELLVLEAVHLVKMWVEDHPVTVSGESWDNLLKEAIYTAEMNLENEVNSARYNTQPSEVWAGIGMIWRLEHESKHEGSDKISGTHLE